MSKAKPRRAAGFQVFKNQPLASARIDGSCHQNSLARIPWFFSRKINRRVGIRIQVDKDTREIKNVFQKMHFKKSKMGCHHPTCLSLAQKAYHA
jgi:hypothetical protein